MVFSEYKIKNYLFKVIMLRITRLTLSILLIFCIVSCEQDVTFDFEHTPELCFNCVLNPDSLIESRLSLTQALTDATVLQWIEGASIIIYEDGQSLGQLEDQGNGRYTLPVNPRAESRYDVTVDVKGYPQLSASTTVPPVPTVNIIGHDKNDKYLKIVEIVDSEGENYYWLYSLFFYGYKGPYYLYASVSTDSPFADSFNREYDDEAVYFGYYYHYYCRLPDIGFEGKTHHFYYPAGDSTRFFCQSTDMHFDKYMKTSLQIHINTWDELPLKEPVQVYSNIINGTGIFGSYNSVMHQF